MKLKKFATKGDDSRVSVEDGGFAWTDKSWEDKPVLRKQDEFQSKVQYPWKIHLGLSTPT